MRPTDDERDRPRALAALPREEAPPAGLEERVVRRLGERGLLRRRGAARWLAPLAASLVGLAGGWLARGASSAPSAVVEDPRPLFLLLVSADPEAGPPEAERVELYRNWAIGLAEEGRLAGAEKLQADGVVLDGAAAPERPVAADPSTPSGFFLVRAANLEEAVEIARESPHARLGGRVTVRPVDPV